jgi:hypothetical protein
LHGLRDVDDRPAGCYTRGCKGSGDAASQAIFEEYEETGHGCGVVSLLASTSLSNAVLHHVPSEGKNIEVALRELEQEGGAAAVAAVPLSGSSSVPGEGLGMAPALLEGPSEALLQHQKEKKCRGEAAGYDDYGGANSWQPPNGRGEGHLPQDHDSGEFLLMGAHGGMRLSSTIPGGLLVPEELPGFKCDRTLLFTPAAFGAALRVSERPAGDGQEQEMLSGRSQCDTLEWGMHGANLVGSVGFWLCSFFGFYAFPAMRFQVWGMAFSCLWGSCAFLVGGVLQLLLVAQSGSSA